MPYKQYPSMPVRWRLKAQDGAPCGFDCPQQPRFELEPGFLMPGDQDAVNRINKMNGVQPPNVMKALGVIVLGIVLVILCRAFFEGWGFEPIFWAGGVAAAAGVALLVFGNFFEKWELHAYVARLQAVAAEQGSGRWEIQLETKCEHDCSCYNGYRDFCCRKAIYAMWYPANEAVPGTNQMSIPVAQAIGGSAPQNSMLP